VLQLGCAAVLCSDVLGRAVVFKTTHSVYALARGSAKGGGQLVRGSGFMGAGARRLQCCSCECAAVLCCAAMSWAVLWSSVSNHALRLCTCTCGGSHHALLVVHARVVGRRRSCWAGIGYPCMCTRHHIVVT
jgi:hypothetical protein